MHYKINKQLILEFVMPSQKQNPLSQANANFLSGGSSSDTSDTAFKTANGFKQSKMEAMLHKSKENALQNTTGGEVLDDEERMKLKQLHANV